MRTTQQFSITLPLEMFKVVERKIQIRGLCLGQRSHGDGLRALLDRDAALERWLKEEVVAGHKEYISDPSKGVPADALLARVKARTACKAG